MTKKMLINAADSEEVRIAIIDSSGRLQDFEIETRGVEKNKGNIYEGLVTAVDPSFNAAFVDYGADKEGFLTANDVRPTLASTPPDPDKPPRINELLKKGQSILVQITKDEVGTKGAVLTTYLSIAGRYVVLMPESETQGVSRKISDEDTRKKMKEAAAKLAAPKGMGVIIRTAGHDRNKTDLNRDLKYLLRLWENILKLRVQAKAPALILKEQDVIIRALRDYFSGEIDEVILDTDEAYDRAAEYMMLVMPRQKSVLTRYVGRRPIFHHYRVEEQLDTIYTPRVALPSGGSLVIEPTEALVSIDVNSGKQKSGGHEETALATNLQAANEVARQLRLRDLGGIIVIDFIDMFARKNQQKVERTLKEALKNDKARVNVGRISRNGTLELTRQRIRSALLTTVFGPCQACRGTGHILSPSSHAVAILRRLRDRAARGDLLRAHVRVEPEAANCLRTSKWHAVEELQRRSNVKIDITSEPRFRPGESDFAFETDDLAVPAPLEEPNFGPAPRFEGPDAEMDVDVEADADTVLDADGETEVKRPRAGASRPSQSRTAASRQPEKTTGSRRSGRLSDVLGEVDTGGFHFNLPTFAFVEDAPEVAERRREPRRSAPEASRTTTPPNADSPEPRRRRRSRRRRSTGSATSLGPAATSLERFGAPPPGPPKAPRVSQGHVSRDPVSLLRRIGNWVLGGG